MNGYDYLNRGNSYLKQNNLEEATANWREASKFGIKEAYFLLWKYSLNSPDFQNSNQEIKTKITNSVKGLLNNLKTEPNFENLVRHVIRLQGQTVAENIYKSLQFGWENNGNAPVSYSEIYYRIFSELYTDKKLSAILNNLKKPEPKSSQPSNALTSSEKLSNFIEKYILVILAVSILLYFVLPPIIERLTPVDILAERIHEKSRYKFNGAICNDGWTSHSQGQGTCSWHGGVDYYFDKGDYSKTIEECRQEAMKISWLSP